VREGESIRVQWIFESVTTVGMYNKKEEKEKSSMDQKRSVV